MLGSITRTHARGPTISGANQRPHIFCLKCPKIGPKLFRVQQIRNSLDEMLDQESSNILPRNFEPVLVQALCYISLLDTSVHSHGSRVLSMTFGVLLCQLSRYKESSLWRGWLYMNGAKSYHTDFYGDTGHRYSKHRVTLPYISNRLIPLT